MSLGRSFDFIGFEAAGNVVERAENFVGITAIWRLMQISAKAVNEKDFSQVLSSNRC